MPKLPYSGRQTLCHHPLLLSHYPKALLHGPNDDDGEEVASDRPQCLSQLKQYHAHETATKIDNTTCLFKGEHFISAKWGFRKLILNLSKQPCFYHSWSDQSVVNGHPVLETRQKQQTTWRILLKPSLKIVCPSSQSRKLCHLKTVAVSLWRKWIVPSYS